MMWLGSYFHHGYGGGSAVSDVGSMVVHAVIYGVVFRLLRGLSVVELVAIGALAIAAALYFRRRSW